MKTKDSTKEILLLENVTLIESGTTHLAGETIKVSEGTATKLINDKIAKDNAN